MEAAVTRLYNNLRIWLSTGDISAGQPLCLRTGKKQDLLVFQTGRETHTVEGAQRGTEPI